MMTRQTPPTQRRIAFRPSAPVALFLVVSACLSWCVHAEPILKHIQTIHDVTPAASSLVISPDGKNVYLAGRASLQTFAREPDTNQWRSANTDLETHYTTASLQDNIIMSADGKTAYTTEFFNGLIRTYKRRPLSGALALTDEARRGDGPRVPGYVYDAAITPDGTMLLSTTTMPNALTSLFTDAATPSLVFADSLAEGSLGLQDLDLPVSLVIAPDSRFAYVVATESSELAIVSVNTATGALTLVDTLTEGIGGISGLAWPTSVFLSPDGKHLYVLSLYEDTVTIFSRDEASGALALVDVLHRTDPGLEELEIPLDIIFTPNGQQTYVLCGDSDYPILLFTRDGNTGELTLVEPIQGEQEWGYDRYDTGALTPDGTELLLNCIDDSGLSVFSRDTTSGALAFQYRTWPEKLGIGTVVDLALSPGATHAITLNSIPGSLGLFTRDPKTGMLTFDRHWNELFTGFPNFLLYAAESLQMSPDGKYLYIACNIDLGILVCSVNLETQSLSIIQDTASDLGNEAKFGAYNDFAMSPDGTTIYAITRNADRIDVFSRDLTTGMLAFVETRTNGSDDVDGLDDPVSIVVAPNGKNVYVSTDDTNALVAFTRDPSTGALTYLQTLRDDVDGVDGLRLGVSLVLSNDGLNLYAAAALDQSVAVFDRDPADGSLTFANVVRDGDNGAQGISTPDELLLAPNDETLYLSCSKDDTILVFERDTSNGSLTFSEIQNVGTYGNFLPKYLAASPDSAYVYAASSESSSLCVLRNADVTPAAGDPRLTVAPKFKKLGASSGTFTVTIDQSASGNVEWDTDITQGYDWLVPSLAKLSGSAAIEIAYTANTSPTSRTGTIQVIPEYPLLSPYAVLITQGPTGDINGDTFTNAIDVQLVINGVLGLDTQNLNTDVNNDNVRNAVDIQAVINAALGLPS